MEKKIYREMPMACNDLLLLSTSFKLISTTEGVLARSRGSSGWT